MIEFNHHAHIIVLSDAEHAGRVLLVVRVQVIKAGESADKAATCSAGTEKKQGVANKAAARSDQETRSNC